MIFNAIAKGTEQYKDGINISKWQSKINGTQIHHDKISFRECSTNCVKLKK